MRPEILGIHHVTAIAGDPQRNVEFYTKILGLRLVKKTVNYDDPGTYHLYYGDETGSPGTLLTFFPWPGARRGRSGTGQAIATSFLIPERALGFWRERLKNSGVIPSEPSQRFDETFISFSDPDGLQLELVASTLAENRQPSDWGPVSAELAIRGFFGVTLAEETHEPTEQLLTQTLGFTRVGESGQRVRYRSAAAAGAGFLDIWASSSIPRGQISVGSVHHVAWRTADDTPQERWRQTISGLGVGVSPVMDRQYFHSIYFREPGGVLFEIATDTPGFTVDESVKALGSRLSLPAWLEPMREHLQRTLPPLQMSA
jgi:glyoxalase family protein